MYKKITLLFLLIAGLSLLSSCGGEKRCRPKRGLYSKIEQPNFQHIESDLVLLDKTEK